MDRRLDFHGILVEVNGNRNVYYQPDQNTRMVYPAIVYDLDYMSTRYGGNLPYNVQRRYQVTHITRSADSGILEKLAALPTAAFDRAFKSDGLYHTVFNIYY